MFRLLEDPGYTPHGWSISDSFLKSLLFLCLLGFTPQAILLSAEEAAAAKEETTVPQTENAETIVSEKDSVSLVKDSSVAEAVKRRPDLNFANVTIDGENSGVSLSSLQADDVESVEVMKAVTPDQDADSRGGSISLKTRPTFAQTKRITALEGSWSYDSLDGAQGYRGRIFFSGPLNDAGTWGARASISYRDSPYAMETLYQDWESRSLENTKHFVLRDTGYGHYQRDYDSIDFNASIDYKASDFLNFFLRNSLSNRDYLTTYNVLKFRFFRGNLVSVDENGADFENADIRNSIWRYNTRSDEAESTLGGNYEKDDLLIDFKITTKDDEVEYLDYFAIDMVQDQSDLRYDLDDPKFPTTRITNDRELRDPTAYLLEDLEDRYFLGDESDRIAAINIRQKNLFGYSNMFVKGGYKTRSRKYHRISAVDIYDNYEGTFTLADILSDASFPELLEGRYHLDTLPDPVGAKQFFESNRDGFLLNERRTRENSDPNTYHVNETVDAVYGMINFESGRWRSILGFRNESTEVDFLGNEVVLGKNEEGETVYLETNPVPGKSSYAHLFPNAHFRYKWTDKVTLIGSFSKTIDRPAYTYLVPYRRVNLEEQQIDEGNPNLLPTIFTNYDLSVDLALPKRALLSLELFSRSVEDFIFSRNQIVADGIYKGFELDRVENSSEADIHGATLTWRQPLESFRLPEGLSLNANYTTQKTQIEYPARPNEILPLTHMPENELKLTLSYQKDKFFAQLRYTYEDLVPSRIAGTADEDLYYLPNDQVNMSLTYQLRKNVRLFADVQNLTNEASYDRYEGDPGRPAGYRYLPWSMSSGIRVEL